MFTRVIVEGADQQGKSTLCKILSEKLGWEVIHYGKPHKDFNFFADYLTAANTISDRNYLSEVVYSRIDGRGSRVIHQHALEAQMKHVRTLMILVDRGTSFVFDKTRHEDYSDIDIAKAITIYREEFKKVNLVKVILNPNQLCTDSVIDMLVNVIKSV